MQEIDGIPTKTIPTLSVGLGISHFMNPMPKQLHLARQAEKLAKSNDLPSDEQKKRTSCPSFSLALAHRSASVKNGTMRTKK